MLSLKTFKTTAIAGALVLGSAVGISTNAHAAAANAVSTFDWGTFSISLIGDLGITFDSQSDSAVATAASNGVNPLVTFGPVVTPNWNDGVFASAETGNAHYNGTTTAQTPVVVDEVTTGAFQSDGHVFSDRAGWTVSVDSSAIRSLDFTVNGSGVVVFQVDYSLFADAGDGGSSIDGDTASAAARVSALLKNLTNNSTPVGTATASILASFAAGENFGSSDSTSSTLAVALFFNSGDQGHLEFTTNTLVNTSSPAAVPLPPAGWLLGASLLMLARRRRV